MKYRTVKRLIRGIRLGSDVQGDVNSLGAYVILLVLCTLAHITMSQAMRKCVICEQQRRRSACASVRSDQHLCCLLPRELNTLSLYSRNFKILASLLS